MKKQQTVKTEQNSNSDDYFDFNTTKPEDQETIIVNLRVIGEMRNVVGIYLKNESCLSIYFSKSSSVKIPINDKDNLKWKRNKQ